MNPHDKIPNAIDVKNLSFHYGKGKNQVSIFKNFNFQVKEGEFVAIKGSSGSGKSTLFYLMSGLLRNYQGQVEIFGKDISQLNEKELSLLRNQTLGFIFQQFYLLSKQNVLQNILLPSDYPLEFKSQKKEMENDAKELAKDLGIFERLNHIPSELSGGQQQRVAIARALLNHPKLVFADEPTGNLDSKSSETIMGYLKKIHSEGKTILLITHEDDVAKQASRIVTLKDGEIVEDIQNTPIKKKEVVSSIQAPHPKKPGHLFFNVLPVVLQNAFQHKVRTFLTMIGVIIGVASVCSLVTIGKYTEERIMDGFNDMGANVTQIHGNLNWNLKATDQYPAKFNFFDPEHDLDPLYDLFKKEIVMLTPYLEAWDSNVAYGGIEVDEGPRLYGVNHFGHHILGHEIALGKGINSHHVERKSPVCVIGHAFLGRIFKNESPIGKIIKVTNSENVINCEVIGLLAPINTSSGGQNLDVYLPYTFFRQAMMHWWRRQIRSAMIQISPQTDLVHFKNAVIGWFKNKYGVSGSFRLNHNSLLREQMKRFVMLFNILLSSVAVISLVVGGMGIANMMLISVSERLNEIGIRKSFGATKKSIRLQFILEALFVCSVAGVLGILIGFSFYELLIYIGSQYLDKIKFVWFIEWKAIIWSFLSIVVVGVLSGLIPALKAEKTEVIDALRSD